MGASRLIFPPPEDSARVSSKIQDLPLGTEGSSPSRVQALLLPCSRVQSPQVPPVQSEGRCSCTGHPWRLCTAWRIALVRPTLCPSRPPLTSAHAEDSAEHAQKQGQLQEDQEHEVDSAERNSVGDTVTGNEVPPHREASGHFPPHLCLCPDSRAQTTQNQI